MGGVGVEQRSAPPDFSEHPALPVRANRREGGPWGGGTGPPPRLLATVGVGGCEGIDGRGVPRGIFCPSGEGYTFLRRSIWFLTPYKSRAHNPLMTKSAELL